MSEIKVTHKLRTHYIEVWFWSGQPYNEAPDWIRAKFNFQELVERPVGKYALRDEEGNFYKWMNAISFRELYERVMP